MRRIRLEVGRLSGLVPDAVRFCFDLVAAGTTCEGAALEIDEPLGRARVPRLRRRSSRPARCSPLCPCGSADVARRRAGASCGSERWRWPEMCGTCGCSDAAGAGDRPGPARTTTGTATATRPPEPPDRRRAGGRRSSPRTTGSPAANRRGFAGRGIVALNLMSSPGSGKTTLLERTVARPRAPSCRLRCWRATRRRCSTPSGSAPPAPGSSRSTPGAGCHLDADMVAAALRDARPAPTAPCCSWRTSATSCAPRCSTSARRARVVIMSVTEGADKPLKYPHMFRTADLVLLNKVDLLPVRRLRRRGVRRRRAAGAARRRGAGGVGHRGDGLDGWYAWLRARHAPA